MALAPDHLSAYALIVEPGTSLARRIAGGELSDVDGDDQAEKYELADRRLAAAGLQWYEVSNWARSTSTQSAHNLVYWRGGHWWGFGPGAHSHVGGVRWWNVKHPRAYAGRLASDLSPALAREDLDSQTRGVERVMLEVRTRTGLDSAVLSQTSRDSVRDLVSEGLLEEDAWRSGRVVLTLRGRLLADLVVRRLTLD